MAFGLALELDMSVSSFVSSFEMIVYMHLGFSFHVFGFFKHISNVKSKKYHLRNEKLQVEKSLNAPLKVFRFVM